MTTLITLSEQGQMTLPKDLLDELGLKPFDQVEVVVESTGGARLRKARPSLRSLMGSLPLDVSVEEAIAEAKVERGKAHLRKSSDEA